MSKPKVAISWNSSCGGCDESIVDLETKIIDVASQVEFVLWPCAMDFKYEDIEKMEDGEITVSLINGGIQNTDQKHIVKLLRKKSQIVVAFGSCASMGGVPSLINLTNMVDAMKDVYFKLPSVDNKSKIHPLSESSVDGMKLTLPGLFKTLYKLSDVIEVDYYLPGCPPTAKMIEGAINAILTGNLPEKGSYIASDKSLCFSCARNETKPDSLEISEIKRIHEIKADPEKCFLAQGIICMGPVTRDGCDSPCINGNMPCTGCMGGINNCDQGAKMIGALAGIFKADNEDELKKFIDSIVDPSGTFYRYSMSASYLGNKRKEDSK